jgi:maleate isomerase
VTYRVGLVVPSSNTTMETEVPELLRRHPEQFTCHSSRVAMRQVTAEELARMNRESDRCAAELADARCDVLAYACLVAVMAEGPGAHVKTEARLAETANAPVVSSAGALVAALSTMDARRVAIIAPYLRPLTAKVVDYLAAAGVTVVDAISLEIADNVAVGRRDPMDLVALADRLDVRDADAVVLSACVQMPSLPAVPVVERRLGRPVVTAATATVHQVLDRLGLATRVPDAGALLSGSRAVTPAA